MQFLPKTAYIRGKKMPIFEKKDMGQDFIERLIDGTDEIYLLEQFFVDEAIQDYVKNCMQEDKQLRKKIIKGFIQKVNTLPVHRR